MLKLTCLAVWTEHCYTQKPFIIKKDADGSLKATIVDFLKRDGIDMYFNHFCLECLDGWGNLIYIGYNDNVFSLSLEIDDAGDSQIICLPEKEDINIRL